MLGEAMPHEVDPCREVKKLYDDMPGGVIGGAMTVQAIQNAEED
jgi:hypothetical protein